MAIARVSATMWSNATVRQLSGGGNNYVEKIANAAIAAGTTLVAGVQIIGDKVPTFSDDVNGAWAGGNIWLPAASGALGARWGLAWFPNSAAGTPTIRATLPDDTVNRSIAIAAYTGLDLTSPIILVGGNNGVSAEGSSDSAMDPGAITSTTDALFIGLAAWSSPAGAATAGASFTGYQITNGDYEWAIEDRIVTGGATVNPSWSNKTFWKALGIALKAASTGSSGNPHASKQANGGFNELSGNIR